MDKCGAFVVEVTKLRQFILLPCIWTPAMAGYQAVYEPGDALAFARIGVGDERRADDSDRRLIADVDDRALGRSRLRWRACLLRRDCSIGEAGRLVVVSLYQCGATCDHHCKQGDDRQQNHVAIFFANSHAGRTVTAAAGSRRECTACDRRHSI